ncbi:LuxR C-terminal-related transcriptional regulator [Dasania marina]|uniref:LuxR C-terminal-related transcriptional regulator n=1 Tax=Dasania marina TaxID=471499 RepID=UPI0030DB6A55|tara:strand:+ start:9548 stop:10405 length:858 start_codon:yes stop_codon:yes gene_type:complete
MQEYANSLALLGHAIAQQGGADFFSALSQSFVALPRCGGHVVILYYPANSKPQCLYNDCKTENTYQLEVQAYIDGPYIFDPYYQAQLDGLADGAYRLRDIAPDNFKKTEYYKHYYLPSLLADELCYLVTLGEQEYIHFSLTPADTSHKFPKSVLRYLNSLHTVIPALIKQHWQLSHAQSTRPVGEQYLNNTLQHALKHFGSSLLSPREQQVLQMLLRGHSGKSAAQRLGISSETVKLHRKNMYQKLDVSTLSELFYLFIDSLSLANTNSPSDPLIKYMGKQVAST